MSPSCSRSAVRTTCAVCCSRWISGRRATYWVATSKLRPLRGNDRCVAQQLGDGLQIQGRRHHHDTQILAQVLLTLDAQRQSQVGVQTAFVELIEDHAADAGEARVVLQHAREDALRDHFDARLAAHPRLEPRAKSDAAADGFAEQMRHAAGDGARRNAPRFEHQDLSAPEPGAVARKKSGTMVLLPAPGGASSSTLRRSARASASAGRASLIGKSGSGGGLTSA